MATLVVLQITEFRKFPIVVLVIQVNWYLLPVWSDYVYETIQIMNLRNRANRLSYWRIMLDMEQLWVNQHFHTGTNNEPCTQCTLQYTSKCIIDEVDHSHWVMQGVANYTTAFDGFSF